MKTAPPLLLFQLHNIIITATQHHYQPVLSFQFPMSPLPPPKKESSGGAVTTSQAASFSTTMVETDNVSTVSASYINHFVKTRSDDDVFWSIFSNAFFLGGGLCYIIGSSWDLSLSKSGDDPQNMFLYYSVWILGPFVYLLNSSIDVIWAIRSMNSDRTRRGLKRFFITAQEHAANVANEGDSGKDILVALEKFDMHAASMDDQLIEGARLSGKRGVLTRSESSNVMSKLRRHFGHRRDLSSATAFGAAAIFGTASAIGWASGNMNEDVVERLELISIHLYLLSAVFALVGRRQEDTPGESGGLQDFFENAQALENVGDSIFGIASIVDVVLADFTFDDDNAVWPVISAVLWMLDAMLYLRGDFVVLYRNIKMSGFEDQLLDENERNVEMMSESVGKGNQHTIV